MRQKPDLWKWRERLAKTSEWTGNPQHALEQWQYLGDHRRDVASWRESIRLAGLLQDNRALLRGWEGLGKIHSLDGNEWRQLIDAYENCGEPEKAIQKLSEHLQVKSDRELMSRLVDLLLRKGRDSQALKCLQDMSARFGTAPDIALRRAEILSRHGRIQESAEAMHGVADGALQPAERVRFIRLRAGTAEWMQRYGEALQAYADLYQTGLYDLEDIRSLCEVARDRDSTLALKAAVAGWSKFHYPEFFIYYLERCVQADRWDLASRALARLTPENWSLFSETPYFFNLVARIHQAEGRESLARREFLYALKMNPESEDLRSGYLWLLMDQGRLSDLAEYADQWDRGTSNGPAMLDPLAVAYKLLQQNRKALEYFRMLDKEGKRRDFPFLVSYADLLEQSGDGEGARIIFLRAQSVLADAASGNVPHNPLEWREAVARWSWRFGGAPETGKRMDALLTSRSGGEGTKELALSWRMEQGQNPEDAMAAITGIARHNAPFPPWAQLAVAMRMDDERKVAEILDEHEATLSPVDKANAAAFLGLRKQTSIYAREGYGNPLAPPDAARGLRSLTLSGSQAATGNFEVTSNPLYLDRMSSVSAEIPLESKNTLQAVAESHTRERISSLIGMPAPNHEDDGSLALRHNGARGSTEISLGVRSTQRSAMARTESPVLSFTGLQTWRPIREANLTLAYRWHAESDESPTLSLLSLKNETRAGTELDLPERTRLNLSVARGYFYGWNRIWYGSSTLLQGSLEQRPLRALALGVATAFNRFRAAPAIADRFGNPFIGGVMPAGDFPLTFYHYSTYVEWQDQSMESRSHWPKPYLSGEIGANYFPSVPGKDNAYWSDDFGLRGGLAAFPTRGQRLALEGSYTKGLQKHDGREYGLSGHYHFFFE